MDINKYGTLRKKINKGIPFDPIEQRDYEVCDYFVDQQYFFNKRADYCRFIRYYLNILGSWPSIPNSEDIGHFNSAFADVISHTFQAHKKEIEKLTPKMTSN
jgi:hypothetical protein